MMEIKVTKNPHPAQKPEDESQLGFGQIFTDHMFLMDWDRGRGWHDARIVPFGNLTMHPASTALHYGAEVFEGLKAYRTADGSIQLFRPQENFARLNRSAARMSLPQLDEQFALRALTELVRLDADWVPHGFGTSLYIRPFLLGDDEHLGVHAINHVRFLIILSPSGLYYAAGLDPVSIMIENEDVRTVRGGTGEAKCGGNYGASVRAGDRAEARGYAQVLWLDGVERRYIEEVGSMNIMFKIAGRVVTPMLTGSILPGITRKSIIEMLKSEGTPVEERRISADELVAAAKDGTLEEAFGCGTAAVVSPVGLLAYQGQEYVINGGKTGPVSQHLYDELTGIQWGRQPDRFGWTYPIR